MNETFPMREGLVFEPLVSLPYGEYHDSPSLPITSNLKEGVISPLYPEFLLFIRSC